jgi:hypothetical protein
MTDWWKILATAAEEVEQFFEEVGKAVENFTDEVGETIESVVEQLQETITIEIDQYIQDFFELIIEAGSEVEEILFEDLDELTNDSEFIFMRQESPTAKHHPACIGCHHYHGVVYGDNLLVCAMHPYGWNDDNCPDWEGNLPNNSNWEK